MDIHQSKVAIDCGCSFAYKEQGFLARLSLWYEHEHLLSPTQTSFDK